MGMRMVYVKFELGRNFLVRAEHDADLIQYVTELAEKEAIAVATFTAIGAFKRAKLEFYDQEKQEYHEITLDSPQEIGSCVGNISVKNKRPFVHAHAVLADRNGNAKAGHLLDGIVFACEVHLRELKGAKLERKHEKVTGLSLWDIEQ